MTFIVSSSSVITRRPLTVSTLARKIGPKPSNSSLRPLSVRSLSLSSSLPLSLFFGNNRNRNCDGEGHQQRQKQKRWNRGVATIAAKMNKESSKTDPSGVDGTTTTMKDMNLFTAINNAMDIAMDTDETCILFGEDVGFGGVFRCSQNLQEKYGAHRVFNTPLSENGIVGMGIGYASMGGTCISEIQFADYIFPAMDQIINEMAKFRYRSGNQWNCGKLTIRTPCGAVGHGGHYHSQSPEAYLAHTPGLVVVMPSGPYNAKGLLLSSIRSKDPVVFLEPKVLYRTAIESVPEHEDYEIPLGKANIVREGTDVTIIGYGGHLQNVLRPTVDTAWSKHQISCELIDLQTLLPWDTETVIASVQKTGKCIISHEAPITCGYGAELSASIQERCFASLEAPITRVCGYDTPFPLVFEKYYVPNEAKTMQAIVDVMEYAK